MAAESPVLTRPDDPTNIGRSPRFNGTTVAFEEFARPLSSPLLIQAGTVIPSATPGQRIYNLLPTAWKVARLDATLDGAASSGNTVVQVIADGSVVATLTIPAGQNAATQAVTLSVPGGGWLQARVTSAGAGARDLAVQFSGVQVVQDGLYSAAQTLPWALYDAEAGQPKGVGYVQLSGASGDYISTPDSPALRITGDLEIVARVRATDWSSGSTQGIVARQQSGSQRSYYLDLSATGTLALNLSADGTNASAPASGNAVPFADGATGWVKATWRQSDGRVQYFTAADQETEPTAWAQLGANKTIAIASIFPGTSMLEIGSRFGGTLNFAGRVYRVIVRNGIGGPAVADFDASKCYGPGYLNEGTLPTDGGGSKYVPLTGQSGDCIWAADRPALRITGDLEIVARVAPNWPALTIETLVAKWDQVGNKAYNLSLSSTNRPRLYLSVDGITTIAYDPTATVPFAPYTTGWVKVTRRESDGRIQFFTAPDAVTEPAAGEWQQLGTDVSGVTGPLYAGVARLVLGAQGDGVTLVADGRLYRAIVRNGIAGTTVADFNAEQADTFAQASDGVGNGWVINSPKHHGNWTLSLPKVYDTSGNNHPPAVFGSGSNQPTWLPWKGNSYVYLPGVASNHVYSTNGSIKTSITYWDAAVKFAFNAGGTAQKVAGISSTHFDFGLTSSNKLLISLLMTNLVGRVGNAESPMAVPLVPGLPMWVRGRVSQATALCEYWVSFDATDDASQVNWISLGSSVGTNPGGAVLLTSSSAVLYGTFSAGVGGAAGKLYGGQQIIDDGTTVSTNRFRASTMLQQATSPCDTGQLIGVSRSSAGGKSVTLSPAARSTRSMIQTASDDWIDVPAAAVPALDTYQPPSAVTAVFRRWHNPGTQGHPVFTTKSSVGNVQLGAALRLTTTAGGTDIAAFVGDGVNSDGTNATTDTAFGERSVATMRVGNVSPFVSARSNAGVTATDSARATTGTTSTAGAGRIGAFLAGVGPIDMEFEALATYRRDPGAGIHDQLVAGYNGGA